MTPSPDIRCPWCGYPCKCGEFSWTRDGLIPQACEDLMRASAPAMLANRPVRKK